MPVPVGSDTSAPFDVDATQVNSSALDPNTAQALLDKISSGQALLPAEKTAAAKLPPSVLSKAALSGTAPLPEASDVGTAMALQPKKIYGPGGAAPSQSIPDPGVAIGSANAAAAARTMRPGPPTSGQSAGAAAGLPLKTPVIVGETPTPPTPPYQANTNTGVTDPLWVTPSKTGAPVAPITGGKQTPMVAAPGPAAKSQQVTAIAQSIQQSPDAPPSLKNMDGKKLASLIGSIVDAVGVGLSARGGVNRETLLRKQQELAAQTSAKLMEAKGQAAIDIDKQTKLLPIELQNAIALARANGDIASENAIRTKAGVAPIDLSNQEQLAAYASNLDIEAKKKLFAMGYPIPGMDMGLMINPGQAGANLGATMAGVTLK